jgi:hypothetical protein
VSSLIDLLMKSNSGRNVNQAITSCVHGLEWREMVVGILSRTGGRAHRQSAYFHCREKDRGKGLEAQSEDGIPDMLAKSLEGSKELKSVAVFTTPVGAGVAGPITPGAVYEVTISAMPGDQRRYQLANHSLGCRRRSGLGTWNRNEPGAAAKSTQHPGKAENGVVRKIEDGKAYSGLPM